MPISKREFYAAQGLGYEMQDRETNTRYDLVLPWIPARTDLIVREVGCKFGVLRDKLAQVGIQNYGAVDIDHHTIDRIPDKKPGQFSVHDVNQGLPYLDGSLDVLVCLEVLEHLDNPSRFFLEARRVLQRVGMLILSVPNPYCWVEIVGNLRRAPVREGHIGRFTFQNIDALLHFSGLRLIERKGTYTRLPFAKRLFGRDILFRTQGEFFTRSYLYRIGAIDG